MAQLKMSKGKVGISIQMILMSRLFILWMTLCSSILAVLLVKSRSSITYSNYNSYVDFFRWGPSESLLILGIKIDNAFKYIIVIAYCFINSIVRALYQNMMKPWIINIVQDETRDKSQLIVKHVYEIVAVATVYNWFDWFLYMAILMAQVDMIVYEISADLITSLFTTWYFLQSRYKTQLPDILTEQIDHGNEMLPLNQVIISPFAIHNNTTYDHYS